MKTEKLNRFLKSPLNIVYIVVILLTLLYHLGYQLGKFWYYFTH